MTAELLSQMLDVCWKSNKKGVDRKYQQIL